LLWTTDLGAMSSTDGGSRWAAQITPTVLAYDTWLAAAPGYLLGIDGGGGTPASSDGGRAWTRRQIPISPADEVLAAALGPGGQAIAVAGEGAGCQRLNRPS
jgi:hypothetical protein